MKSIIRPFSIKAMNPPILCLIGLTVLLCMLRLNYYDWPPNRDVTFYAVMSHELIEGEMLYTDFWDIKPPAIFFSYAVGEALFGYGPRTLYFLNLVCALIVLYGVYAAATVYECTPSAGIWAALFWTALSGDIALQMHDPNTEAFMNAFLIWAFFLFIPKGNKHFGYWRAILIGLLFAWASLYKQVIIIIPLLLSIGHIALPPAGTNRRQAFAHVLIIASIGIVAWSLVTAYMAFTGRFQLFIDTIFTYSMAYAGNPTGNVVAATSSNKLLLSVQRFQVVLPMVLFASMGVLWSLFRLRSRNWLMVSLYAVGAFLSIALPGKFYRHYFQIGIPPLIVAAAWTTTIFHRSGSRWKTLIPHFGAAAVLIFVIANQVPYYTSKPEVLLNNTYAKLYLVTQRIGRRMASILENDETIFQWGAESGLYFYSQRRPPASFNGWSHYSQTFGKSFTRQTLDKLKASPPDVIMIAKYFARVRPDHPILKWIIDNYNSFDRLSSDASEYYVMMVRRGSAIESRLSLLQNSPI